SKKKVIDTSVYTNKWFRYPNQTKAKVGGEREKGIHVIEHGNLIDFVIENIQNGSKCINNKKYIEHHVESQKNNSSQIKKYKDDNKSDNESGNESGNESNYEFGIESNEEWYNEPKSDSDNESQNDSDNGCENKSGNKSKDGSENESENKSKTKTEDKYSDSEN